MKECSLREENKKDKIKNKKKECRLRESAAPSLLGPLLLRQKTTQLQPETENSNLERIDK